MPEQTLEAPPHRIPEPPQSIPEERPGITAAELLYRARWILGALALLLISAAIVVWARTRPGYDPFGWLLWGKLTVHGKLDTNGAPSWKPLPFLFTVPYALFGHYALWLWMVTSVAISLSGAVFAWRVAFWLTAAPPERRYAAYVAGAAAALGVLGIRDYAHYVLSVQSDSMIVSLCLAAIDCHLCGRRRWAFSLGVLGALGRPEVWPFLAAYSIWAWRAIPAMRRLIVGGLLVIPLFWFGIPALTARSFFVAGENALHSPRELHQSKVLGTVHRFFQLHELPMWIAALMATALALLRRHRAVLALAAAAVAWVVVEIAFVLHGWPGVPRYLFEPVAAACVLAGVLAGRVILELPVFAARHLRRLSPARLGPRLATQLGAWGAVLLLALLAGGMVRPARQRISTERIDLKHERARTQELGRLSKVVSILGPARILACGQPHIPIAYQSALGWYLDLEIGALYVEPHLFDAHPHPLVNMYPIRNGWKVFTSHVTPASAARCRGLHIHYRT